MEENKYPLYLNQPNLVVDSAEIPAGPPAETNPVAKNFLCGNHYIL